MKSDFTYSLQSLPKEIKTLILLTQVAMLAGFLMGIGLVDQKSEFKPNGIYSQYNGNEDDEEAKVMFFKKSKQEIFITIHTHLLSLSVIFLINGLLIFGAKIRATGKKWLMWEPLISLFVTFISIYFLWATQAMFWTYIIIISGFLMTLTFLMGQTIVFYQLVKRSKE